MLRISPKIKNILNVNFAIMFKILWEYLCKNSTSVLLVFGDCERRRSLDLSTLLPLRESEIGDRDRKRNDLDEPEKDLLLLASLPRLRYEDFFLQAVSLITFALLLYSFSETAQIMPSLIKILTLLIANLTKT